MLAKKYRLQASFFTRVAREKIRPRASYQTLIGAVKIFSSELSFSRFAAVAPLASFKKSAARTAVRRKAYEAVRSARLYKTPGRDCVLYLKASAETASPEQVAAELKKILA